MAKATTRQFQTLELRIKELEFSVEQLKLKLEDLVVRAEQIEADEPEPEQNEPSLEDLLGYKVAKTLSDNDIFTINQVKQATDKSLLNLNGVGRARLNTIREALNDL